MKILIIFTTFLFLLGICSQFNIVHGQDEETTPLGSLLPRIDQKYFKLNPSGQTYTLNIELPNGSTRNDMVELRAPNTPEEELHIKGEILNYYPGSGIIILYEAGKNGYKAKYKFITFGVDTLSLGADTLKTFGG